MRDSDFVSAIRSTTRLNTAEEAHGAARATLAVLGQRLYGGEARDLAAQLPEGLAAAMPPTGGGESFGVDEFYHRIAELEGHDCTDRRARQHARAVVAALQTAVSPGEVADILAQLPADYDDLFAAGPVHHH